MQRTAVLSRLSFAIIVCSLHLPRTAAADGSRDYERGRACFTNGDYPCALAKYDQALEAAPAEMKARVYLAIAQTQLQLGRPLEARAALSHAAAAIPPAEAHPGSLTRSEQKRIGDGIEYLDGVLARLVVTTEQPGTSISIDGGAAQPSPLSAPIYLQAGTHEVEAGFHKPVKQLIRLKEGEVRELKLTPEVAPGRLSHERTNAERKTGTVENSSSAGAPSPASPHGQSRPAGDTQATHSLVVPYAAAAVSLLGIGLGLGFSIASIDDYNAATQLGCNKNSCPSWESARLNRRALASGNIATGAFGASVIAAAAGTLWWYFKSKDVRVGISSDVRTATTTLKLVSSW